MIHHTSNSGVIYDATLHALVFLCITQHTKFEVPSFTNSEAIIGAKFQEGSRGPDQAH